MCVQVVDLKAVEWARSSQAATEQRLAVLIDDFDFQRAAATLARKQHEEHLSGIIKALQQTIQKCKDELALTKTERDAACTKLADLGTKNSTLLEEHAQLQVMCKCLQVSILQSTLSFYLGICSLTRALRAF